MLSRIVTRTLPVALALAMMAGVSARAQTFTLLHEFTGGTDGAGPEAGVTIDAAGHLLGTTTAGGRGNGTVFELKRAGSGWVFAPLYSFRGGNDGAVPFGRVIFGPNGTVYGTTRQGGGGTQCVGGCGTVFNLRPQARACSSVLCPWTESVLYAFQGGFLGDGFAPSGDLVFDPSGNAYGVTGGGGVQSAGTVYDLTPSNGGWTENVLHNFMTGQNDGQNPLTGMVLNGALYGAAPGGGQYSGGVVYELARSGAGWVESLIHSFQPASDGRNPTGVVADSVGNLYGGTAYDGQFGGGTVWELSPSNGGWTFSVLYQNQEGGCGIAGPLTIDAMGNIYGVDCDTVFELRPSAGGWAYQELYRFTGGSNGISPSGSLLLDASGNIYGTTYSGGIGSCFRGCGVVFEISR